MEKTFKDAAISPDEVDYVCAHGTGTNQNDKEESAAINYLFGGRKVPVSSIKSMLGHTMGAASALESISCCLAIKNSLIPPTINFETPDPDCDIDCVPNTPREADLKVVLNNSYAFGGNNCCVAFAKV
jgi:3-oxoacyl-[acyl-carrier-protein] synthase II